MRQSVNDVQELEHRSRPPVAEYQGFRGRTGSGLAVKMNWQAAYSGDELGKRVELRFGLAPIVTVYPVRAERSHELQVGTVVPGILRTFTARHLVPFVSAHLCQEALQ